MGAPISLKPATKASFSGKKTLKIYVVRLLFQNKNGAVRPKKLSLSDKIGMLISGLNTDFLEVSAQALASETSFSLKKSENSAFLGYFFRSKTGAVGLLLFS